MRTTLTSLVASLVPGTALASAPAAAADAALAAGSPVAMPQWAIVALVALTILALLATTSFISRSLKDWSLAAALSEEVELIQRASDGTETRSTQLAPSSSRFIALYGLVAVLVMFVGFGIVLLWFAASGAPIDRMAQDLATYLLYGVVMFAPYAVNKLSGVFSSLLPRV